jgi:3-hydroxyacyl-CoA dehydrogenase/enoyl-CoA hydratase/3-hydroxybutyryl-CoA epimerase
VARGVARVRELVDEGMAKRRFTRFEGAEIQHRVSGTTDYSGFAQTDLAIEAVFEDLAVKQQVVADLEAVMRPDAVIATNTSALPIGQVAAKAAHPERIVGMHFFSPAHRMPLLEVVRGARSADWAVATAALLGSHLGKTVIVVGDGPGFYTTRVLAVMLSEAVELLAEGVGMEVVDEAMTAFGFPVGPFRLYDEVGLEVAKHIAESMAPIAAERPRSADVVAALVRQGATGKRGGRGFYVWPEKHALRIPVPVPLPGHGEQPRPNPAALSALGSPARRALAPEAIQDRLGLIFVNEAIRCLEEGVVQSATDGDLGAVLGVGFPPFRGGPFHYADGRGLEDVQRALERLAAANGPRYAPAALLTEYARSGQRFYPR